MEHCNAFIEHHISNYFNRAWRKDTKWTFVNLTPAGSVIPMSWRGAVP